MKRHPEGDRPAFTFMMGGKETEILQTVGFLDDSGSPISVCIEWAIEQGLIKEGEIPRKTMPLEDGWKLRT